MEASRALDAFKNLYGFDALDTFSAGDLPALYGALSRVRAYDDEFRSLLW